MHYYRKNIGDYAKKTGRLTMRQHGAYTLLIDACYDRERFPTLEEAIEWTWALTQEEIADVEFVLKRFFTLDGDRYVQSRIQDELDDYHNLSNKNKQIALEREAKRRGESTTRTPVVHETPPNQEPLTTNHKPIKPLKAAPPIDLFFEESWSCYPKRPGASKQGSLKAWKARVKAGVDPQVMVQGVKRYADYCKASGIDPQFIKQPATFFGPDEHYLADWTPLASQSQPKDLPLGTDAQIEHAYRVECGGDPSKARFNSYFEMRKFIVDRREQRKVAA